MSLRKRDLVNLRQVRGADSKQGPKYIVQEKLTSNYAPRPNATASQTAEQRARTVQQAAGDIRDLRDRPWFSIDNIDTLDLDPSA